MLIDDALAVDNAEDAVDAIAEPMWHRIEEDWRRLSPVEQVIFGIWSLKVEVCNGGFAQFFFNDVGAAATQILGSLGRVGATGAADTLKRALEIVGPDTSTTDWRARQERVDTLEPYQSEQLDVLNELFYELLPDTMEKVRAFARANRAALSDTQAR